ncbi:hypothetical protein [Mangrovibacillus cuniculi]|uniref:Uncharacterized protein n=1 Tax=Mangrovibacillus cuniculi TaxID=2593652 RepID=A0A7S8C9X1_9BACI|nr:hypothetical protein [Mangrovibacillus cuniculi]QPC46062.1 hypothetical protein G8O30_03350 [Mangrovibacillus cuniculi]
MTEKKNIFDQLMGAKYTRGNQEVNQVEEPSEHSEEELLNQVPLPKWLEDVDMDQLLEHGTTLYSSYEELKPYIKKYGPKILSYLAEKIEKS